MFQVRHAKRTYNALLKTRYKTPACWKFMEIDLSGKHLTMGFIIDTNGI
jgi:hypothetical protein